MFEFSSGELLLKTPFRLLLCGPSQSGKTFLAANLIKQRDVLFDKSPTGILYVYSEWQSLYQKLEDDQGVVFTQTLPETLPNNGLVIIDDQMLDISKKTVSLFTKESHHSNCSIIFMVQALFGTKLQRLLSLNSTYIILMKSPRDTLSVSTLGKQMFPGNAQRLATAYKYATVNPYSYLLVDLHAETDDNLRLRSRIFPEESPVLIYK